MLSRVRGEVGQGLTEYGMILILVAIALVLSLTVFGEQVSDVYQWVVDNLPF